MAQARTDADGVVLSDAAGPVAAIVSIETYRELRAARDAADIALCEESKAHPEGAMTLDEVVAVLDSEDANRR